MYDYLHPSLLYLSCAHISNIPQNKRRPKQFPKKVVRKHLDITHDCHRLTIFLFALFYVYIFLNIILHLVLNYDLKF